jgi:hypothetical protein
VWGHAGNSCESVKKLGLFCFTIVPSSPCIWFISTVPRFELHYLIAGPLKKANHFMALSEFLPGFSYTCLLSILFLYSLYFYFHSRNIKAEMPQRHRVRHDIPSIKHEHTEIGKLATLPSIDRLFSAFLFVFVSLTALSTLQSSPSCKTPAPICISEQC